MLFQLLSLSWEKNEVKIINYQIDHEVKINRHNHFENC